MASSVNPILEIPNASSTFLQGGGALTSSLPLVTPIAFPATSGPSPRKLLAESQLPRSSASSDNGIGGNATDVSPIFRAKKTAWNFPSNSAIEVGSIMDTASWPALSESARSSPKSISSDSVKVSLASSPSGLQATINQNSQPPRDKAPNCGAVTINGNGSSNAGLVVPSFLPLTAESVPAELPNSENSCFSNKNITTTTIINNNNNSNNNIGNDLNYKPKTTAFLPNSHEKNDHQRGYGVRRGNNNLRGGNEWSYQNFGRGVHMQQMHQQQGVGPFPRPSPVANSPFIAPSLPLGPFPNHIGFTDFQSPVYYVAAPMAPFTSPQVVLYPAIDPLQAMLLKQIDYYFSTDNLCKDLYLRQKMDAEGWVPISLIAGFNRVKLLTNNIQYILDTVQQSSVVEVQGEKIRRRNDWKTWVLYPINNQTSNFDNLTTRMENFYLDLDDTKNGDLNGSAKNEGAFARSASAKLNSRKPINDFEEGVAQVPAYSDRVWNVRTLIRNDTM